jgi:hypothetical protein
MSGWSAAFRYVRRSPFAFGLCLLAFLFAIEAKTAWYAPTAGLGSNISAAKALPADSPKLVEHGISSPDTAHSVIAFIAQVAILAAALISTSAAAIQANEPVRRQIFIDPSSSPATFFRPPPAV